MMRDRGRNGLKRALLQESLSLSLPQAKEVHGYLCASGAGIEHKSFLTAKLINMYVLCDHGTGMAHARQVFDKTLHRTVLVWNAMIRGCVRNKLYEEALAYYHTMQRVTLPDYHTFSCVVKACAELSGVHEGKRIHNHLIKSGFDLGISMGNALIALYAKCGEFEDARNVFDKMPQRDIISWNAMISSCTQNGYHKEALRLYHQMEQPDLVTISTVLPACAASGDLTEGKGIHGYIIKTGLQLDLFAGSSLIDMYAKCNNVQYSRQIFDKMSHKDVVLWNAMIAGYAHNGHCDETFALFREMQLSGLKPTNVTIASVMPACSQLTLLQYGKALHAYVLRSGFDSNAFVNSALIDMYAKSGTMDLARQVFDRMSQRDVVSWTAVITGYGLHGRSEDVLALFNKMSSSGMKPDNVTFVSILSACSHAGLVSKAWQYFDLISHDHNITLGLEHYACMVDLLSRSGRLDEAYNFITKMPLEPNSGIWGALLGACRIHCNVELGERVAEHLFELDPRNEGYYVLLSNIYATAGKWDGVAKVRKMMKDKRIKKEARVQLD